MLLIFKHPDNRAFYFAPTDCFIALTLTPATFLIVLAVGGNKFDNFIRDTGVGVIKRGTHSLKAQAFQQPG